MNVVERRLSGSLIGKAHQGTGKLQERVHEKVETLWPYGGFAMQRMNQMMTP
jgi:hypothetical protein